MIQNLSPKCTLVEKTVPVLIAESKMELMGKFCNEPIYQFNVKMCGCGNVRMRKMLKQMIE